jgi:uncharacterized protein
LIQSLVSSGHKISVLSRKPGKTLDLPNVNFLYWDGKNVESWGDSLNRVDAVINLAGESIGNFPWSQKRKKLFRESRLNAGKALMGAIRNANHRPNIFIQASAVGFYGPHGNEIVDETFMAGGDFSARLCIDWEASTGEAEGFGMRRVVIRTGVVLSAKGGVLPLMALPVRLFIGGKLGLGSQGIPWIHIEDEVRAIHFLLENPSARGVYNLSSPNPAANEVFLKTLAEVLKRPFWFHAPRIVIKLALGEMSTLLLDGQFLVPRRLIESGFKFKFETLRPAFQDLMLRE